MAKKSLFAVAIFMVFWAATHVSAMHTSQLSSISETSRTKYNQTFTLSEMHKKCAEYLRTTLSEFLQKVNKTATNDGTANMGQKVEDLLNKKVHALMGRCDPTTLGVAQFVATNVDREEKGLRIEQLVIQKMQLTPNMRSVGDKGNRQMNRTNNETTSKPAMAMRTLTSKECSESQEALVAEWERQRYEIDEQAMLIEQLKEEIAALKLSFNNVHQTDLQKITDEQMEINQLKKSLAEKDVEIARLKSEKMTADQNNQKLSAEKIECESQVKNLINQIQTLEMSATKLMDRNLCEEQKKQQEQSLTMIFNEEKKNLVASALECANKVEQLTNEVSVLLNLKEADANRCKDEMEQQKKHEENLTMNFNEEKKNLVASATECASKVEQLKIELSVFAAQKEAENKKCQEDMEEQKKQLEQKLTMIFNEERMVFVASATECSNKVDQLQNELSVLGDQKIAEIKHCKEDMEQQKKQYEQNWVIINEEKMNLANSATECANKVEQLKTELSILAAQKEVEIKKCKEDMEEQNKQQEQKLTMIFNEERIMFTANAAECSNKVDKLQNEISVLGNQKEAESKQCEEQIKTLTFTVSNSVDKGIHEALKHQCEAEINVKKNCEQDTASQKIIIDNLTIEKQQVQDALSLSQFTNSQTISNLQAALENEKTSATSMAVQLQHCNQKAIDCTTHVSQKELEWTKRETELQDEKKKCDDKMTYLEISVQQSNSQHASELKICQEGVTAFKTEMSRLETVASEKNQQMQSCIDERSNLTSELVSANIALTTLKESSNSVTVIREQYERLADTCLRDMAVLMRAISRRNQKFIAYWKLIEGDSFMSVVGLSEKAQNELNTVMQLQLDINPLQCNQTNNQFALL